MLKKWHKMVKIIPVVKINYMKSFEIVKKAPAIVVRLQDILTKGTATPNYLFKRIYSCGGLHNFLDYSGIIILSLVMRDELIWKLSITQCAELINSLKPNFYTTIDGATYDEHEEGSLKEIVRISKETKELISLCPDIIPIGQVKGCNEMQIRFHLNFLKKLGIRVFTFHTGDFFRNGDKNGIQKAKYFSNIIKRDNNLLLLYGFGSQKRLIEFSFADAYITYGHIVTAKNGMKFVGTKRERFSNASFFEIASHNFNQMLLNVENIKNQTKLFVRRGRKWAAEGVEKGLVIQKQIIGN